MKIKLIKVPSAIEGITKTVGWTLTAETKEEQVMLGSIRHIEYWGREEEIPVYGGYTPDPENSRYVQTIIFSTKEHQHRVIDGLVEEIITE